MKRNSIAAGLAAFALATLAPPALAGRVSAYDDANFGMEVAGQPDATAGAWAFAEGIGRIDAWWNLCKWPEKQEWLALREESVALAARVYVKAGLSAEELRRRIK